MRVFVKAEKIIEAAKVLQDDRKHLPSGCILDGDAVDKEENLSREIDLLLKEIRQLLYNQGKTEHYVEGYFDAKRWRLV